MIGQAVRSFFESLGNLVKIPELRSKIFYTALFLVIYRIGSHIPIPGIQLETLAKIQGQFGEGMGGILVLLSTVSGGTLGNCAIFSLGIMPYISASIIFSLLVKIVPALEAIAKEGPSGYRKINEYTRYATVPLCILQAWMIVKLLVRPHQGYYLVAPEQATLTFEILSVVTLTAGAVFLMWLGEQINEYGLGNGVSILIMAGIVSRMPHETLLIFRQAQQGEGIRKFFILMALFSLIIAAVIYMTYGQRKIGIQQAKHVRGNKVVGGQKHFLPLKVNQAGVMPVIFASSLLVFPITIFSYFGRDGEQLFSWGGFWYISVYILLIYFFSYFWTSLMFQPVEMAEQLKEHGSIIPGIRPGNQTAKYLEGVMLHITFVGAAFLSLIALTPQLLALSLSLNPGSYLMFFAYNLGGTSILIVVGVILDMTQKLESHLLMRHYDGFVKRSRSR